ncbi:MAG: AAA family ATPase [Bacillota bacterium]
MEKKGGHDPRPKSLGEVLEWVEDGKVGPAGALVLFQEVSQVGEAAGRQELPAKGQVRPGIDESLSELDQLIGLGEVKELVRELRAFVEVQKRRARAGLATEPLVLHMIFKGNPGTGKTTVARILGRILRDMGVLQKGHLTEVERADLVGEYIGHTAQKTRDQLKRALGGILFIDEAYSLARGGEKDFGKEAIDTLVKAMEDHKDDLVLILAGYQEEMERFIRSNPGLRSRFPIHISFPDYSIDELLNIADLILKRRQYRLSEEARQQLSLLLKAGIQREPVPSNARLVRNIIERSIRRQALRLLHQADATREDLMLITKEELEGIKPDEGMLDPW